jgi:hypothetical protein
VILTEIDELVRKLMNNEREIEVICREKERKKKLRERYSRKRESEARSEFVFYILFSLP